MSITIVSPVLSAAIGPPSAASGVMWPIMKPWGAPEKRPSVISPPERPVPEPRALDGAGHVEHLAHAGAALGALPADHDHVVGLDLRGLHRGEGVFLPIEDPRGPTVHVLLLTGDLGHAAIGREVAAQDHETTLRLDRIVERVDDFLALRLACGSRL